MIFKSPHPTLSLPQGKDAILPKFLLDPVHSSDRAEQSVLYPAPSTSDGVFAERKDAKPLSLKGMTDLAYGIANGLLNGKLDNGKKAFTKGDVVAFYTPNQHDYVPIVLGIQLVGGIAALCNPSYTTGELAHQLRMTRARAIFTTSNAGFHKNPKEIPESPFTRAKEAAKLAFTEKDDDSAGGFDKLEQEPTVLTFEEDEKNGIQNVLLTEEVKEEDKVKIDERTSTIESDDAAVYCFSSGTSGLPKAVTLTHANMVSNTIQATFMLYDRMNKAVEDGVKYSSDGKTGWYDKAPEKGEGKDQRPEIQSKSGKDNNASPTTSPSKKGMGKLLDHFKNGFSVGNNKKSQSKSQSSKEEEEGLARIESRPKDEQEFHIDVLPQFHCYGLLVNLVAIHTLTPRIILPRFHLETFLQSVQEHGVTFSFVVPPILLALAKHPLVEKYDVSTLWRVASGAASLPDEITNAVGARLGIVCTDGYGMTEMSPIVALQTVKDVKIAPNTVGVLAPNTEALVMDANGNQLSQGGEGELLLRGPQMMKGYLENEEANEKAFYIDEKNNEKWLRTGDVVKIDEKGFIKITDRLKDVIKSKGFQVSPAELEAILFKDERIQDVAVIGKIDQNDGGSEKPWAFVVGHESVSKQLNDEKEKTSLEKSILQKVNDQVAGYKKIAGITWLDALPKSDSGKVLKKNLASR